MKMTKTFSCLVPVTHSLVVVFPNHQSMVTTKTMRVWSKISGSVLMKVEGRSAHLRLIYDRALTR